MMHGQYESICTWFGYESFFTWEMSVILYSLAKKFHKPIKNSVGGKTGIRYLEKQFRYLYHLCYGFDAFKKNGLFK